MIIGGFQSFSLIDYPDKICAIVFTQGCNFRCPYCHNPELIDAKRSGSDGFKEEEILSFLEKRRGKLEAVTITGGEPLLQAGLEDFLLKVKRLGYLVKLDTNGSFPQRLEKVLESKAVDYIAMDIKTSLDRYESVVRRKVETAQILRSVGLIMGSGLGYEFRTTVVKPLVEKEDFTKIGELVKDCRLYVLQRFVSSKVLDDEYLDMQSYSDEELLSFKQIMDEFVQRCIVR